MAAGHVAVARPGHGEYDLRHGLPHHRRPLRRQRPVLRDGRDHSPLRALANGVDGGNGVYGYGPAGTFPANTYNSENYWVDVIFTTTLGPDTTPPTVASTNPLPGAQGVAASIDPSATFNEPVTPTTISAATVELRDPTGALVSANVTYDIASRTAFLDPTGGSRTDDLYGNNQRRHHGSARQGSSGNALSANFTWSFTTGAAPPPPPTEGPGGPILVVSSAGNPSQPLLRRDSARGGLQRLHRHGSLDGDHHHACGV